MKKIVFILCLVACWACGSRQRNYFGAEITPEKIDIQRFDMAFLSMDTVEIASSVRKLYADFPEFMLLFVEDVLGIPTFDTAYLESVLPQFLSDTLYGFAETNRQTLRTFADISAIEKELGEAFGRLHYLFPTMQVPKIYFFVSGFNRSVMTSDQFIAVGVDMYLGSDYPYYNRVVYDYQKYTMRPECIPVDIVSVCLFQNIPMTSTRSRLLENMLYRGRVMYLLSVLFPKEKKSEIMGYKPEQWEWCERYEAEVWATLLDRKDIFKTDALTITKYLNEAPFTSEISTESPGRLGTWLGWRIVESYMQNNPEVTMQELMSEPDAQKILELSKYKP